MQTHVHLSRRRTFPPSEEDLIYAEEVWPQVGRRGNSVERVDEIVIHLRFQRTLPSLLSSRIIPRSASSLRMRSEEAKSRRLRAAWRSATSFSISASLKPSPSLP